MSERFPATQEPKKTAAQVIAGYICGDLCHLSPETVTAKQSLIPHRHARLGVEPADAAAVGVD